MRRRTPFWILTALVLWLPTGAWVRGESLPFGALNVVHWGMDQGLAPGPVNTAIQTRDGYLWFGTDDGLVRFDGVRPRIFDSRNTPTLKSSRIATLFEDRSGALWIGTKGGGLTRLSQGEFTTFGKADGLENEQIRAVCEDESGVIWVGTDGGGLFRFTGGHFSQWQSSAGINESFVNALAADHEGSIFVGYNSGLVRIHGGHVESFPAKNKLRTHDASALYCDSKGVIWIGGRDGVELFDHGEFSEPPALKPLTRIESFCGSADGSVWIGTDSGLYHLKGNQLAHYTIKDGLSGKISACLVSDQEGNLWVGNEASGIDQLRPTRFTVYSTAQGLAHEITTSICQDQEGSIWIGCHSGLNRLRDGHITRFSTKDGLSGDLVLSVCADHEGGIWVGTLSGLNLFKDGKFKTFTAADGMPSKAIWCTYCDRQGTVWVGTHSGLVRIRDGTLKVFNYDNAGLSHNDVRAICEDQQGHLWVGTSYGLNRLNGDRFENFIKVSPDLALEIVYTLFADAHGALWIGTADHGLARYKDGRFTHYTSRNGLFNDTIFQILEDGRQDLWMTCGSGVFKVPEADLDAFASGRTSKINCEVFGKADGLLSPECTGSIQPTGLKDRQGQLWFTTAKGVAVINPQNTARNVVPPPVYVERVSVNGSPLPLSSNVTVGPGGGEVQIDYTALSFVAPGQVKFKYRLDGLEDSWIDAGTRRVAYYPHLPPGQYRFMVTACNNDGVWNRTGASFGLIMQPFFWQTGAFRIGVISAALLASALLAAWIVAIRHRRQLARLERKHAIELERTRIARDMHDGVGSSLVKISMLGEAVEGQLDASPSREQVRRMTLAARNAVRDMDEIVWAVNPKNDTLENLANYVCQFAREFFADSAVECHLDVPVDLPAWPLRAEVRHNLLLVIKEALNNVAKHARASHVKLQLELAARRLTIRIEDDGRGCTPEERRSMGNGLENMSRRLTDIGGRFEWNSKPGQGTVICIAVELDERTALTNGEWP